MSDINVTVEDATPINVTVEDTTPITVTVSDATPINVTATASTPITATVAPSTPINVTIGIGYAAVSGLRERAEIEGAFKVARSTQYTEYTIVANQLTAIDIWNGAGKGTKLFSKTLTYTGSQLTETAITDEVEGNTLTKTFTYSGDNLLTRTAVLT